jgi:hypothetical protein
MPALNALSPIPANHTENTLPRPGTFPERHAPPAPVSERALVARFDELGLDHVSSVGGKAASLGEMYRVLSRKGVRIPNGFATTVTAYDQFMNAPVPAGAWEDARLLGPRSHDVHVAHEDVEQLGKLVQPRGTEEPTDRRDARIVLRRPHLGRRLVDTHRAELVDREDLPTLIVGPTAVGARPRAAVTTVDSHAWLGVDGRTR